MSDKVRMEVESEANAGVEEESRESFMVGFWNR